MSPGAEAIALRLEHVLHDAKTLHEMVRLARVKLQETPAISHEDILELQKIILIHSG